MSERKLFILVESEYDTIFLEKIILDYLKQSYKEIEFFEYARIPPETIVNVLKSKIEMNFNYFFLVDLDANICFPEKKDFIRRSIPILHIEKIIVVIKEMESWIIAGIVKEVLYDLGSKREIVTSLGIHKRSFCSDEFYDKDFMKLIPKKLRSKRLFVMDLLEFYDINLAKRRNLSFEYFFDNFV